MPPPTAYTESTLKAYMVTVLSDIGASLGWTDGTNEIAEAVNGALLAYGVADIADATNIGRLRALARREAWQAATDALASRFDFSADGASVSRKQMFDAAAAKLRQARDDALMFGDGYSVRVDRVVRPNDPYAELPDEARVF